MMTNPLQATFVTDVPFWNAATGAQLRILQLIQQQQDGALAQIRNMSLEISF